MAQHIQYLLALGVILMTAKLAMCQIGQLSDLEKFALTRDAMVRDDADALLYGFFPAWGVVLFLLGGFFVILSVLSGILFMLGCRA